MHTKKNIDKRHAIKAEAPHTYWQKPAYNFPMHKLPEWLFFRSKNFNSSYVVANLLRRSSK